MNIFILKKKYIYSVRYHLYIINIESTNGLLLFLKTTNICSTIIKLK